MTSHAQFAEITSLTDDPVRRVAAGPEPAAPCAIASQITGVRAFIVMGKA
jgi:hypothetical protein